MSCTYVPGQTALLKAFFLDPDTRLGLAPDTLTLLVTDALGVQTVITDGFDNPKPGLYVRKILTYDAPGEWPYRFEATGNFEAAAQNSLEVLPSNQA